jgi:galactokinase
VDTKGSHADLTDDYAAIPAEMKQLAAFFGKSCLRELDEETFYENIPKLRREISDRAVLRGIHFFSEQARVQEGKDALRADDFEGFLDVIRRSGLSSVQLLQNIYSPKDVSTQNVMIALAVTDHILQENHSGVCRIHGGGFAGTIQAFVKTGMTGEYKRKIETVFGEDTCHILQIRPCGGIEIV